MSSLISVTSIRRCLALYALVAALAFSGFSLAADEAGKFLFVLGEVTVKRDTLIPAKKGMAVQPGDQVITGEKGRAQLLMIDNAKIALRPKTSFEVQQYSLPESSGESLAVTGTEVAGGKSVLRLIEGGFRTISGSVGKGENDDYAVKTPVATIGIRGTDYTVVLTGETDKPTLFLGVSDGEVSVSNNASELSVFPGEYVKVSDADGEAELLNDPPEILLDEDEGIESDESDDSGSEDSGSVDREADSGEADSGSESVGSGSGSGDSEGSGSEGGAADGGSGDSGSGGTSGASDTGDDAPSGTFRAGNERRAPSASEQGTPTPNNTSTTTAEFEEPVQPVESSGGDLVGGTAPNTVAPVSFSLPAGGNSLAQTGVSRNEVLRDGADNLTEFTAAVTTNAGAQSAAINIGSAQNQNTGFAVSSGIRWGRWSNGVINIATTPDPTSVDVQESSLHWVAGPTEGSEPVLPSMGTASYQLLGNTDPTDNQGNVGVLGNASLEANFTNATVNASVDLSINNQLWNASAADAPIVDAVFFDNFDSVIITDAAGGVSDGNGGLSGFFTAPDESGNPAGAGMTYTLNDANNTQTINGAAVFGNPQ